MRYVIVGRVMGDLAMNRAEAEQDHALDAQTSAQVMVGVRQS